ncbi:MAG TPA: ABC transporter substrate-binding protein [Dissulfurispiraceae bacterium]|nr:ABC transporter substrate-binding protein [Dissulfurispiraceae bacterium]
MMKKGIAALILLAIMILPFQAFAVAAMETVHHYADKVLDVLRDPALKAESARRIKKEKIRSIADEMFDFTELSKRTLAQNWNRFDNGQQKEFIHLFKSLLADSYADKILAYTNEKIVFSKEIELTDKTAEVRSTVIGKTAEIPINYRVILKGDGWKVYDVVIEGVSLVNNYRSQFREILLNKSPESLLETLRKKVGKS